MRAKCMPSSTRIIGIAKRCKDHKRVSRIASLPLLKEKARATKDHDQTSQCHNDIGQRAMSFHRCRVWVDWLPWFSQEKSQLGEKETHAVHRMKDRCGKEQILDDLEGRRSEERHQPCPRLFAAHPVCCFDNVQNHVRDQPDARKAMSQI